jgi:hypothetical protein
MSRRPDPVRINEARRAATRSRLLGEGELPDRVDRLIAAWQAEAARRDLRPDSTYWEAARKWIADQQSRTTRGG